MTRILPELSPERASRILLVVPADPCFPHTAAGSFGTRRRNITSPEKREFTLEGRSLQPWAYVGVHNTVRAQEVAGTGDLSSKNRR